MQYFVGDQEYFKGIGKIAFEGKGSKNPLAFKYYDANKLIGGKTMAEHLALQLPTGIASALMGRTPLVVPPWIFLSESLIHLQMQ